MTVGSLVGTSQSRLKHLHKHTGGFHRSHAATTKTCKHPKQHEAMCSGSTTGLSIRSALVDLVDCNRRHGTLEHSRGPRLLVLYQTDLEPTCRYGQALASVCGLRSGSSMCRIPVNAHKMLSDIEYCPCSPGIQAADLSDTGHEMPMSVLWRLGQPLLHAFPVCITLVTLRAATCFNISLSCSSRS